MDIYNLNRRRRPAGADRQAAGRGPRLPFRSCRPRAPGGGPICGGTFRRARYADLNRDLSAPVSREQRAAIPCRDPSDIRRAGSASWASATTPRSSPTMRPMAPFAARAWWLLRWLGHDARRGARRRLQGLDRRTAARWSPARPRPPPPASRAFTPRRRPPAPWSSTAGGRGRSSSPQRLLVDARAAERFTGTVEPIDPRRRPRARAR